MQILNINKKIIKKYLSSFYVWLFFDNDKYKKNSIDLNKIIITSVFTFSCLFGYVFFPANGFFQYKIVLVSFLIVIPFLYNNFFLKNENIFKKITIGDWKKNTIVLGIGFFLASILLVIVFKYTDFLRQYLLSSKVEISFKSFLFYELIGVSFSVAVYELFFRGFVMFYFAKFFGKWAILIQFLFFITVLLMLQIPFWFYIAYLIFTPFAGWIAYKTNSILYSFLGQLIFIMIMDASFIALTVKS